MTDLSTGLTIVVSHPAATFAEVILRGRLDAVAASGLNAELATLASAGASTLVIDLADVDFVDSAGLAALVRARRYSRQAAGEVVLVRPTRDTAMRVFSLTQFDEVFRMVAARS